ncbi:helix-turn-helix domain-containing protein [Chondrinema litorale]|uniref:helix-turn-helix domain-containing protein n=1 Tax=Chondrinema litorale TaxID=2994555 RepID=UPI0025431E86|nr:helix-turn-helix domain-containing protein [Chondrinema litorale]UZR98252.1 helix-turn-helix domain-containing protein [Chondrinema litorale]
MINPIQAVVNSEKSIAVLPFVNMSNDPENEYFSDGITEEIINALTKIQDLKVIARTSSFAFKGKNLDIRTIGRQLGVSTILEGSVRKIQSRVRITAQLINAEDGLHFWSQNFDRELDDIFTLQDEISLLLANQIRDNFGHFNIQEHLIKQPTKSVKAYDYFLKGRYYQLKWNPESIKKAIEFYDLAISFDAEFARAYYGNLQCYGLLSIWGYMPVEEAMSLAIANFIKGQEIDTDLPEYIQSFIGKSFWEEWNYSQSYDLILQLLEINPHHTDGLEAMAELFMVNGYFEQAEVYVKNALNVDPYSANHYFTYANLFYLQQKFDQALVFLEKSLELNPELELALHLKLMCLIWLNKKETFEQTVILAKDETLLKMLFNCINGNQAKLSDETLEEWANAVEEKSQLIPYKLYILANSLHKEIAIDLLEKFISLKRGQVLYFKYEPFLVSLHQFKEFDSLFVSDFTLPESQPEAKVSSIDKQELNAQKEKLLAYIETNKAYLNPQLSLSFLAEKVGLHPNKLSLLVNEEFKMNFNEFINQYRLTHFKSIALNENYKHLSVLALAYESGFNSKAVFNAFFKKAEGITPSTWLKSARDKQS